MRYGIFLTALVSVCIVTGCGNASSEDKTEPASVTAPADTTAPTTTNPAATPANTTIAAPIINKGQQPTLVQQPAGTTTAALNPEHGKPGHRCDIAVGAPLNNNPTQPTATIQQPTIESKPVTVSTPVVTQPNSAQGTKTMSSAAGINPEHGKPGHRCDIAVGAPLDSKPTQPAATVQQPTMPNPKQALPFTPITPASNTQPASKTIVAEGMNPEHGKPGHRCDIAVGAPLNSKPVQQPAVIQQPAAATTTKAPVKLQVAEEKVPQVKPKQ